jgi:hypothetical protein
VPEERERERERERRRKEKRKEKGNYQGTGSVVSPSSPSHGGTRLDPFQGYVGSPTKPHEIRVHDDIEACDLPSIGGPHVPHTRRMIHGDLSSILRAKIWCTIAPVLPLIVPAI